MAKTQTKETRPKMEIGDPITTPAFRAAFCYVIEPDSGRELSDDKYKLTALVPKEKEDSLKPLKQAILKTARKQWGEKTKYSELEVPFKDGDEKAEKLSNHAGQIYFQMKTFRKPGIVDVNLDPLDDDKDFYAGCYARASVQPKAYERPVTEIVNGKKRQVNLKGVTLQLRSLQKIRDGEPFGHTINPADEFDEVDPAALDIGEDALDEDFEEIIAKDAKKKGKKVEEAEEEEEAEEID